MFFFSICGPTILVFPHKTLWQYSDRDSPQRDVKRTGYEKIAVFEFRPIFRFISETIEDRTIVTVEREYELVCNDVVYPMVPFSMTLSDLE